MIPWSWSRLTDFEACPLLFKEKHITKSVKFVTNAATERGKTVHLQLEREALRAGYSDEPAVLNTAHVWPIIKSFVKVHDEVFIEEEIALKRNLQTCSWIDKEVWLRAKIDLVGRTNPIGETHGRNMTIIDWKTGQYKPEPDQLRLYNMVAMLRWQTTARVASALVFVDHKKSAPPVTSDRVHDLRALIDEFADRSEAIQIASQKDWWPAQRNYRCKWCAVAMCQHRGGA